MKSRFTIFVLLLCCINIYAQTTVMNNSLKTKIFMKTLPEQVTILVKGNIEKVKSNAENFGYTFHYNAGDIACVTISLDGLSKLIENKFISRAELVDANYQALNDTMVVRNRILPVKQGAAPLPMAYDGTNVIFGIIDTGVDWRHGDFKNADGTTRILYIWDQKVNGGPPSGFNYGKEWTAAQINASLCTHDDDNSGHGTHVAGTAAGNGLAINRFEGCAPKADIIVVSLKGGPQPNIANGVQYIFNKATQLGKPCVVNISVGDYYGSHDGTDLEAQMINNLLMNTQGRVVVAAAGNAGMAKFHTLTQPPAGDTVFTWVQTNTYTAFYSCYADTQQIKNVKINIGANRLNYDNLGSIGFKNYNYALGSPQVDTIKHNGNRIGIIYSSASINTFGVYELYVNIAADSVNVLWRAESIGNGLHHSWNFSFVSQNLPTPGQYPRITKYVMPDTLYSMVSSFQNLDAVITVANYCNAARYYDYNNNLQVAPKPYDKVDDSSVGPTRDGRQKPDIAATGQAVFAALRVALQAGYIGAIPTFLGPGGQHIYGTGTSAASPVVAGFVALFLQAFPNSTHQLVKNHITMCAYSDAYTGLNLPNYAWGYGKLDGYAAMNCIIAGQNILKGDGLYKSYPNPFRDNTKIEFTKTLQGKIAVYSVDGKLLFEDKINADHYELQMGNSNYHGLLIVRVESSSGNAALKLARN